MSVNDDIAKVRYAMEEHLDIDCYCPDHAVKAAMLATLDLLREPTKEMIYACMAAYGGPVLARGRSKSNHRGDRCEAR